MQEETLAEALGRRLRDLAEERADLAQVVAWAGELDLEAGRKPVGSLLYPGREIPSRLEGFVPPTSEEIRALAAVVCRGHLAAEDAVMLLVLRHARGGEGPLLSWLVRFGALHPSQLDDLIGPTGREDGR